MQKAPQFWEIGRYIMLLPNKFLQKLRVVRQMVDDFCRRQPVAI